MKQLLKVRNVQEVAVKPFVNFSNDILMVWNLQEAAAKPLLMVWNLQEAAVKPFTHFSNQRMNCFGTPAMLL